MATAKKPRAVCEVTNSMKDQIEDLARSIKLGKGNMTLAYRRLMELAISQPAHPIHDFPDSAEWKTCVLDPVKPEDDAMFAAYARDHSKTNTRDATFRTLIWRGLSIYIDSRSPAPTSSKT